MVQTSALVPAKGRWGSFGFLAKQAHIGSTFIPISPLGIDRQWQAPYGLLDR